MKKPLTASEMTESFSKMYDTKRNNKIKEITKNKKLNSSLYFLHDSVLIGKKNGNPTEKYKIEELIEKGKNNTLIYKASLKSNGEKRVLKIIQKNNKYLNETKELIKEIDFLEETDNPYIVKLYEFYDCPKVICLVNEYCNGGNLNDKLKEEKQLSELTTSFIIFQILSALSYCHNKKIIHRNLTLSNILIDNSKKYNYIHIKLIDFSSSAKLINGSEMGDSVGNLKYISPEVFTGKYNESRDIWSVGIIMYKLLTGVFPFENQNILKLKALIEISNVDYEKYPLNKVNKECIDLLQKLLKKDKGRINAKDALNHI
jgi:calcium-dependent protein kinase